MGVESFPGDGMARRAEVGFEQMKEKEKRGKVTSPSILC
jgi:hypothetical protein